MTIRQEIDIEAIRTRIAELQTEHRDLDDAIAALNDAGSANHLQVQRMKKRKLMLREQISRLESLILPDIIA
jgi:hypothetical protein